MVTPNSVYDYDMVTRERELKKRQEVLGGYDPEDYVSERVFAPTADGKRVPISLVYRKGTRLDGTSPCLLYGYGSYGATVEPRFSSARVSLLDRGFVYAIANIRGGGALGRPWYEDGKLLRKRNTFEDFIAAAEHLIAENYTSSDRLAIHGGSAGGLLIGAVVNMRPELFRVGLADVPFVDVMTTMLDPTIPLTVIEWEEWGNPNDPEFYDYMASYSPYDNVAARDYPSLFVTAGLNDPRVGYWEPAKWVARLRELKTDGNALLLRTNMGAGHGGASGRYDALKELAEEYAFAITEIAPPGV
jgi:oligopeptidase B